MLQRGTLKTLVAVTLRIDFIANIHVTLAAKDASVALLALRIFASPMEYEKDINLTCKLPQSSNRRF